MKRCPFCFKLPSVRFVQIGSVGLWEIGCDGHLAGVARQPSYEQATQQWDQVMDQITIVARAA